MVGDQDPKYQQYKQLELLLGLIKYSRQLLRQNYHFRI